MNDEFFSVLAHPQFFQKTYHRHGVRGGGIQIIILRCWCFHRIGPVQRNFGKTEALTGPFVCRKVVSGLFLRKTGRGFNEEKGPAEPDDPDPSTPNPNIV